MRNKNVQMSFEDIYNGVSESMENRKSELVSLLEEHINLDELIPHSFHTAFYRRMGRGHLYHLDSFIWFFDSEKAVGIISKHADDYNPEIQQRASGSLRF